MEKEWSEEEISRMEPAEFIFVGTTYQSIDPVTPDRSNSGLNEIEVSVRRGQQTQTFDPEDYLYYLLEWHYKNIVKIKSVYERKKETAKVKNEVAHHIHAFKQRIKRLPKPVEKYDFSYYEMSLNGSLEVLNTEMEVKGLMRAQQNFLIGLAAGFLMGIFGPLIHDFSQWFFSCH